MGIRNATETFIFKAQKKHGTKYDYSQVAYVGCQKEIAIICPEHGLFWIQPTYHLSTSNGGCRACARRIISQGARKFALNMNRVTTEIFIKRAKKVHGNTYDYSKTIYKETHKNIIIICSRHGQFQQAPSNHLQGKGCKLCALVKIRKTVKRTTQSEFEERIFKIHGNKYDISHSVYVGVFEKVEIICREHGLFKSTPHSLFAGHGCPKCAASYFSKPAQRIDKWLISNGFEFKIEKTFPTLRPLSGTKSPPAFDFCIFSHKQLIEFDGEQHFKSVPFFGGEEAYKKRVIYDKLKNQWAKDNDWDLLRIRYDEEDQIENILAQKLLIS